MSRFSTIAGVWLITSISSAQMRSGRGALPDQDKPRSGEQGTQQIGGSGLSFVSKIGSLRCRSDGDAIVGVYTRKGTLIDYLNIACAPIIRFRDGWGWNEKQGYWLANGAGNSSGGGRGRVAYCVGNNERQNHAYVIAGFMAVYKDDNRFLQDIRFECARVTELGPDPWAGLQPGSLLRPGPRAVMVDDDNRIWAGWRSASATIRSYQQG